MSLRLNGSTSGYSEIEAPAVAGDQTFTLPGTGGNLITDVSDLTTQVKSATNASGSAPIYSCRAWVNFSGTGTVVIRDSGNVSSITDNGTGQYTVNFTTAMPDNTYCALAASRTSSGTAIGCCSPVTYTTGSIAVFCSGEITSGGLGYVGRNFNIDHSFVNVAIFR